MVTDKEILDKIHILIHSLRLIPKYASSEAEKRVSNLIIEKYSETCEECREVREKNKIMPQGVGNKNFFDKLGDLMR